MTYRRITKTFRSCNKNEYIHVLENKNEFNAYFKKYVSRKWIYAKDMNFAALQELCHSVDYLIIKPLDLCEGEGVKKIKSPKADNDVDQLFEEYHGQNFMIEECIKQHPNMTFGAKSVNTIRMHSILDKNGDVHLFKPMARVGTGDAIIDNYCGGGCVYEVDLESGIIISPSLSKDHGSYIIHPGTNIQMIGYQIPNWCNVINGVKDAAKSLPQCRFIGWDVAIIENGIELIEGNHNPDYELLEFVGTKGWYGKIKQFI